MMFMIKREYVAVLGLFVFIALESCGLTHSIRLRFCSRLGLPGQGLEAFQELLSGRSFPGDAILAD